ncbi:MAG: aldo/keto reductase [Eubacterium sp.]|nr:aldo/keto reductase [Eubacterium sp.]
MYKAAENRYGYDNFNYCPNGLALPKIAVGLWQNFGKSADYDEIKDIILTAFDMGVTHFDLANNYGPAPGDAERNFGKIFAENLKPYRDELIISSKAGYEMWDGPYGGKGGTRKYITASIDQSLKRMGLDYVDLFYHHCMTPETPLEETALCLSDIIRQGKSLYAGLSNYDGKTMHRMHHRCEDYNVPFIVNQNRYNIFDRRVEENGLKEQGEKKGKGLVAFSPLDCGRLSDKYKNGAPKDSVRGIVPDEKQLAQIKALSEMAAERGETLSQMAIQWLLANGVTTVLVGVRTKAQLLENLDSLNKPELTAEDLAKIDKICKS